MSTNESLATSLFSRSAKLLSAAARIGASELNRRVAPWSAATQRARQAKVIAESLSELKGAVMKIGQLLSLDAEDILPPEIARALERLHGSAEPVGFDVVRRVLEEELGERVALLHELEPNPHAAASIGQVHRAQVDGTSVAVKIQYPGIAECIDSDLAGLQKLVGALLSASGRSIDMQEVFDELENTLRLEADYERELKSMEEFRTLLTNDDRFVVPRAFPELSTRRVLTMSFEEGRPLYEHLRTAPSPAECEWIARALLDLYCIEFFEAGLVQTDPNPGNFMIRSDGRMTLLDFGATVRYDLAFRRSYVELVRVLGTGDRDRIVEAAFQIGFVDERESEETKTLFAEFLKLAVEPFEPTRQPFEFADEDYRRRSREVGRAFTRSLRYSPPPRSLIFLHRKLGGLFKIIKRMDVRMDLSPYWTRFVDGPAP